MIFSTSRRLNSLSYIVITSLTPTIRNDKTLVVKRVTLATHLFLVASLRLDRAFFMVDLNLQARGILNFLIFSHMYLSIPYCVSVALTRTNVHACVVKATTTTLR